MQTVRYRLHQREQVLIRIHGHREALQQLRFQVLQEETIRLPLPVREALAPKQLRLPLLKAEALLYPLLQHRQPAETVMVRQPFLSQQEQALSLTHGRQAEEQMLLPATLQQVITP